MHRYFILNKPPNMVSQFVSPHSVGLLGDLDFTFPPGAHALGRLDKDSEGLLLLTTDKRLPGCCFQAINLTEELILLWFKMKLLPQHLRN